MDDLNLLPIAFADRRPGIANPMQAVARALKPHGHRIIGNDYETLDGLYKLYKVARDEATQRTPQSIHGIPIVINYGGDNDANDTTARSLRMNIAAFTVRIGIPERLHTRESRRLFSGGYDLIAALPHEDASGILPEKLITIPAVPHSITPEKLAQARAIWEPRIWPEGKPEGRKVVSVFVGGSLYAGNKVISPYTEAHAINLVERIKAATAGQDCDILLTTSRRTPKEVADLIRCRMSAYAKHMYFAGSDQENPYLGYAALADALILPAESITQFGELSSIGRMMKREIAHYAFWPHDEETKGNMRRGPEFDYYHWAYLQSHVRPLRGLINYEGSAQTDPSTDILLREIPRRILSSPRVINVPNVA